MKMVLQYVGREKPSCASFLKTIRCRLEHCNRTNIDDFEQVRRTQMVVMKGTLPLELWSLPNCGLILNEDTLDSIAETFRRREITYTSILHGGRTHGIDLSTVALADVYAALIGREISHINRHHFGALTLFRMVTFHAEFLPLELVALPVSVVCFMVDCVMDPLFAHECEYEADEDSMIMLYNAGYNPLGLLWLLEYDARRDSWLQEMWQLILSFCLHMSPPRAWRQANLLQLVEQLHHAPGGEHATQVALI
jgi:hypothetical protein